MLAVVCVVTRRRRKCTLGVLLALVKKASRVYDGAVFTMLTGFLVLLKSFVTVFLLPLNHFG